MINDSEVEIISAKMGVAVRALDLDQSVGDFEYRNVKRTTSEVVYRNLAFVIRRLESVRKRCRGRFVDDAQELETCNRACDLGRFALRIVEVGRNSYHSLRNPLVESILRVFLQLAKHHRRDLCRRPSFAVKDYADISVAQRPNVERHQRPVALDLRVLEASTDEPLDREDCVLRVGDSLILGSVSNKPLLGLRINGDHGRRGSLAVRILYDLRVTSSDHRHRRVRSSQVYS